MAMTRLLVDPETDRSDTFTCFRSHETSPSPEEFSSEKASGMVLRKGTEEHSRTFGACLCRN